MTAPLTEIFPLAGAALITIKPWFETAPARDLLSRCVDHLPRRVPIDPDTQVRPDLDWEFDRSHPLVASLNVAFAAYLEAVEQVAPSLVRAARFDVTVRDAIQRAVDDAALDRRMADRRDALFAQGLTFGEVNRIMNAEFGR